MKLFRIVVVASMLLVGACSGGVAVAATPSSPAALPATPLPVDSVLQVDGRFVAQDGRAFALAERRGRPQLVTMFYTSCPYMCPLLIDAAKGIDHALTADERAKLPVLLVSFDSVRDTPEALQAQATKRKLDTPRWTLATTDAATVRKLAGVLDIRYRALADGGFNHTGVLVLLDADGRILARTEAVGAVPDPVFLKAVRQAIAER